MKRFLPALLFALIEASIVWLVWGWVLVPKFGAPSLTYLDCCLLLLMIATFFPTSYAMQLDAIAKSLKRLEEK